MSRPNFFYLSGNFSSYVTCNLTVNIVNNTKKNTKTGALENVNISCAV